MKQSQRKGGDVKMFRTSIALPEDIYKSLAHLAIDESKTLRELMTEAIQEYLRHKEKGGGKK